LIIEEFGPELIYIPGQSNVVADALSRLPIENDNQLDLNNIEDYLALDDDDLPTSALPISFQTILKHQQKEKNSIKDVKSNKLRFNSFHGGGKTFLLICNDINKIVIPKTLQKRLVDWYHTQLCHPGQIRTYNTIKQHFTWSKLEETVKDTCKRCHTCQITKTHQDKYGKLPMKTPESTPWDVLCVDLIGPYKIKQKNKENVILWAVTMIDPATGWFEMKNIPTKRADIISNVIEQTWLTRYPWPTQIIVDRGKEFMKEFISMIKTITI
jgi:hypothetical protein